MTPPTAPGGPIPLPDELRLALRGMTAREELLEAAIADFRRDRDLTLSLVARRVGLDSVAELIRSYAIDAAVGVLHPRNPTAAEPSHADDRS